MMVTMVFELIYLPNTKRFLLRIINLACLFFSPNKCNDIDFGQLTQLMRFLRLIYLVLVPYIILMWPLNYISPVAFSYFGGYR